MVSVWLCDKGAAKLVGDAVAEERAWKLFGLVPVMSTDPEVVEMWGNRSWWNEPTSLAEGSGESRWQVRRRYQTIHMPRRSRTSSRTELTRSCRVQSCAARASVSGSAGACWSHIGPENSRDLGRVAREKATREGSGDSGRGDGEQPNTREFGHLHILHVIFECTFGKRSWARRMHLRNAQSVLG